MMTRGNPPDTASVLLTTRNPARSNIDVVPTKAKGQVHPAGRP